VAKSDRIPRLLAKLERGRPVTTKGLAEQFEVSEPTIKRDIEFLRSTHRQSIEWVRGSGYVLKRPAPGEQILEMPNLVFSQEEVTALLTLNHLIDSVSPSVLSSELAPIKKRLVEMLGKRKHKAHEMLKRVKVIGFGRRPVKVKHFETVLTALLSRKRLQITYFNRQKNERKDRIVSPQTLVHYRDNWYLDAWCHSQDGLRSFAAECVESAKVIKDKAQEVPPSKLKAHFESGFGIFSGPVKAWATLRFTPTRARWVSGGRRQLSWPLDDNYLGRWGRA
jgi:predicted DNA-binding transcriptional regulator YafY